jgi:hypothetical protein
MFYYYLNAYRNDDRITGASLVCIWHRDLVHGSSEWAPDPLLGTVRSYASVYRQFWSCALQNCFDCLWLIHRLQICICRNGFESVINQHQGQLSVQNSEEHILEIAVSYKVAYNFLLLGLYESFCQKVLENISFWVWVEADWRFTQRWILQLRYTEVWHRVIL